MQRQREEKEVLEANVREQVVSEMMEVISGMQDGFRCVIVCVCVCVCVLFKSNNAFFNTNPAAFRTCYKSISSNVLDVKPTEKEHKSFPFLFCIFSSKEFKMMNAGTEL